MKKRRRAIIPAVQMPYDGRYGTGLKVLLQPRSINPPRKVKAVCAQVRTIFTPQLDFKALSAMPKLGIAVKLLNLQPQRLVAHTLTEIRIEVHHGAFTLHRRGQNPRLTYK